MGQAVTVRWDEIRTLPFGSIVASPNFVNLGGPFEHPARLLILQNFTDALIVISDELFFNAPNYEIVEKLVLPPGGQMILDYMSDQSATGGEFMQAEGTQLYIAYFLVAPTTGNFFASVIYGKGE